MVLALTSAEHRIETGLFVVCLIAGAIALAYTFVKFLSVRVYSKGIEGRGNWGVRKRFYWNQIHELRDDSENGFKATVLKQKETGSEIWMFQDVFESPVFQSAVAPHLDRFQRTHRKLEKSNAANQLARRYGKRTNVLYDLTRLALILGLYFGGAYWWREHTITLTMEYCNREPIEGIEGMTKEACACSAEVIREEYPVHSYWFNLISRSDNDTDRLVQEMESNCRLPQ